MSILFAGQFDFVEHLFLLPPSFVSSEVAFDTKYLEVCLSIRKGVRLAYKLILVAQGVEF